MQNVNSLLKLMLGKKKKKRIHQGIIQIAKMHARDLFNTSV